MALPPSVHDLDALAQLYPHRSPGHLRIVRSQIEQRVQLVEAWNVKPGEKVLEIGCGQGDCTVALAAAVGEEGSVTAVDPASLDYGSPFTLGEAQAHLRSGPLGPRINFIRADPVQFLQETSEHYTTAVMAQCTWYFATPKVFSDILAALLQRADRVCISEYSLTASDYRAVPHVLATLAQASLECRKAESTSNIRTVLSPDRLRNAATAAGYAVQTEALLNAPDGMLDGKWEVDWVLSSDFLREIEGAVRDEKEKSVVLAARDSWTFGQPLSFVCSNMLIFVVSRRKRYSERGAKTRVSKAGASMSMPLRDATSVQRRGSGTCRGPLGIGAHDRRTPTSPRCQTPPWPFHS